jgi:hypothetical protein
MSDQSDDDTVVITLELPAGLTAHLEELRQEFGDELLAGLLHKAIATVQRKLALRGVLLNKEHK